MPDSKSSVKVTVTQASDINGVDHYNVQVKNDPGKFCKAAPGQLACIIGGLQPAKQYTVQATACLDGSSGAHPCNAVAVEGAGWTKPSRKLFSVVFSKISHL